MTWESFRLWVGLAMAALGAWWVGLGPVIEALLILMALDIASGMAAASIAKTLDSRIGWRGVVRKTITLMLVVMAESLEHLAAVGLGAPTAHVPIGEGAALFFCATEGLSVIENASLAGVPIPPIIREALARLKQQGGQDPSAPAPHG